jgi:D-alanyl-D-alanine carboxypeptidase/D-alanyl-D-alanine-endopeptidase (penicillin-binding protein 4)
MWDRTRQVRMHRIAQSLVPAVLLLSVLHARELAPELRAHLAVLGRSARVGFAVYSLTHQQWYITERADEPLIPASTLKLFWSAAALELLGDTAILRTRVCTDGVLLPDGELRGNLYLIGGGDPLLRLEDLEELVAQLRQRGVVRISGSVIADGSLFDGERWRPHYSGDAEVVEPLPPITALGFNRNRVRVLVQANRGKITAQTVPLSPAFQLVVRLSLARSRQRHGVHVSTRVLPSGVQQILLSGRIPPGSTFSAEVMVENPEFATAATFWERLRAGGIQVHGGFATGRAPAGVVELAVLNRPLQELLLLVNKRSDNFVAEHLFKLIGARAAVPGTAQAERARRYLQQQLWQWAIACNECRFRDGSGLSRNNRISARELVCLLEQVWRKPYGGAFWSSLPVAGVDGTLEKRFRTTEAVGRVWAKTGTLRNASGLAGYAMTEFGELLAFAVLSTGNVRHAKALEDSLIVQLLRLPPAAAYSR